MAFAWFRRRRPTPPTPTPRRRSATYRLRVRMPGGAWAEDLSAAIVPDDETPRVEATVPAPGALEFRVAFDEASRKLGWGATVRVSAKDANTFVSRIVFPAPEAFVRGDHLDIDLDDIDLEPVRTARPGTVRNGGGGRWSDGAGEWYPLGCTMLYAFGHWHRGGALRDLVIENTDFLASEGFDYRRVLGEVAWAGDKEIRPDWPGYDAEFGEFLDHGYARGLRTKITVSGGGFPLVPLAERMREIVSTRRHTVFLTEGVNEQNDSATNAIAAARILATVSISAPGRGDTGTDALAREAAAANAAAVCMHTERGYGDGGEPGGRNARQVRQAWDFKEYGGRLVENAEPPGPASSVGQLEDPELFAAFRAASIVCGAGAFCLHPGAGVFGVNYNSEHGFRHARLREVPRILEIAAALRESVVHLPPGVSGWSRFNGGYGGPLFVEGAAGPINKIYGTRSGDAFVEIVIGCSLNGAKQGIEVRALQTLRSCLIVNPANSSEVYYRGRLEAGKPIALAGAWSYLIIGQAG